jgi:hypothetical protein
MKKRFSVFRRALCSVFSLFSLFSLSPSPSLLSQVAKRAAIKENRQERRRTEQWKAGLSSAPAAAAATEFGAKTVNLKEKGEKAAEGDKQKGAKKSQEDGDEEERGGGGGEGGRPDEQVDTLALLHELWEAEVAYMAAKVRVVEALLEGYLHVLEVKPARALAIRMLQIMKLRPRILVGWVAGIVCF